MVNLRKISSILLFAVVFGVFSGPLMAQAADDDDGFWDEPGSVGPGPGGGRDSDRGPGGRDGRPRFGPEDFYEDYLAWLEENYTEEAAELERVHNESSDAFRRRLRISMQKYGHIFHTSRNNPDLAELMKDDLRLKQQRDDLLEEITESDQQSRREQLVEQLEEVISERFDVIIAMRKLQHEQLEERLRQLHRKLEERKKHLELWEQQKQQRLREKLEELLEENESPKFKWD